MFNLKGMSVTTIHETMRCVSYVLANQMQPRAFYAMRAAAKKKEGAAEPEWPRKIFSGVQPTGSLHLGNYLGAVQKWTEMQNSGEDVTFCIVDMHAITVPPEPITLRENIFQMASTMFACGIDPDRSSVFVQSAVKEHTELGWILGCMTTMARLGHLPQYKEKTRIIKDIPLGLFVYPVLQAADILLYKASHVPVGEDQIQHIQLAQHLAKTFNTKYGATFPLCHAVIDDKNAARIRSLREPSKKMSKSDPDPRATINLTDEPEVILEKMKKAVTDCASDVNYNPDTRQGVSNLIIIHSLVTGQKIEDIVEEAKGIDTGKYKLRVADAVIEHLRPIRNKINTYLLKRGELIQTLERGADKARETAKETLYEVKHKMGIGAHHLMPTVLDVQEEVKIPAKVSPPEPKKRIVGGQYEVPEVPKQQLRVEKKRQFRIEINTPTKFDFSVPQDIKPSKSTTSSNTASSHTSSPICPPSSALPVIVANDCIRPVLPADVSKGDVTKDETDSTTDEHKTEIKL